MLAYLSQISLRRCNVVRQMFTGCHHRKTSSRPFPPKLTPPLVPTLPRTQQGTYRPINKHCQCMLQVATGDLQGLPCLEKQPGLRHIANSLPLCQGEQLVIGGEYERRPKTTTTTPSPPTHKNKTHKSLHLSTAIRLASPFPRMPQPLSHTGLWSVLCLYSSAFFVFSVSSSLLLEASICRCVHVCVFACTLGCLFTTLKTLPTRPRTTGAYQGL